MPTAKLGIANNAMFTNQSIIAVFNDLFNCTSLHRLPPFSAPTPIPANIPVTIDVRHAIGYDTLDFAITFFPKAGHIYLVKTESRIDSTNNIITRMKLLDKVPEKGNPNIFRYEEVSFIERQLEQKLFSLKFNDQNKDVLNLPRIKFLEKTAIRPSLASLAMEKTDN